jgi:hypothetical protein
MRSGTDIAMAGTKQIESRGRRAAVQQAGADATEGPAPPELSPFATGPVLLLAAMAIALLLAAGARYGYHRDELYFLEASRHMAWGYVDQPPLSVALVWLSRTAFGDGSFWGLRVFPAVAFGATVVLTGLMAREFGGKRFAQAFAALLLAVSPFLIAAHLAGPTVYDLLAWCLVSLLVIRILRTGEQRLWLLVGLVVGVALLNKHTILFLVIGLVAGLLANRQWRLFASPWLWFAALIALAVWAPNILWQAGHHWPVLEMSGSLQENHSGAGASVTFVVLQFLLPGPWSAPVWLAGLWALWHEQRLRRYRAFSVAYVLLFVTIGCALGDRPYYLGPLYAVLFAAGAEITAGVVAGRRRFFSKQAPRRRLLWRSQRAAWLWVGIFAAVMLPVSLPLLPAPMLATVPLQKANDIMGEEIGWPELARAVAGVYYSLPPEERAKTAIIGGNYGEAGAVDRYGPALGLPRAYSGHNSYWWWGPPPADADNVILVGWSMDRAPTFFTSVRQAATVENSSGVDNEEDGMPILLGRGMQASWSEVWPQFRHYD